MPSKAYSKNRRSIFMGLNIGSDVAHRERSLLSVEDGGSDDVLSRYLFVSRCMLSPHILSKLTFFC
jgi:hypothetical protein